MNVAGSNGGCQQVAALLEKNSKFGVFDNQLCLLDMCFVMVLTAKGIRHKVLILRGIEVSKLGMLHR